MTEHFFIYHIPGVKVGCTRDIRRRIHEQGKPCYELLEVIEAESITPQQVGDIEWRYADNYGYDRGLHYSVSPAVTMTDEARIKMSLAKKGKPRDPAAVAKMRVSNTGQKRSPETKRKIGDANRGRLLGVKRGPCSEERRRKISEALLAYNAPRKKPVVEKEIKPRKHTEETKRKIGDANRGRRHTEETKAKISANSGSRRPEVAAKISASHKGKKKPDGYWEKWGEIRRANNALKKKGLEIATSLGSEIRSEESA